MVRIWLPGERPQSWNTLKRLHWTKWQHEVEKARWLMFQALQDTLGPNQDDWPLFTMPVVITMTVWFANRPQDASNLPLKLYEDGLLTLLIPDDSPPFVAETRQRSRLASKGQPPGVLIEVEKAG